MQPSFNLLAVLNLLGAAQGLLLTLALLGAKGGHRLANRLLAAMTLTIAIVVSGSVWVTTNYVFVLPHLSRLHHPFVFLAGPLLFLYIRTITANDSRFAKQDLLHFIPFAACLLYLLPYYFQSSATKLARLWAEAYQDSLGGWYYVRSATFILQFLVYLILIIATLIRYSRKVKRRDSRDDRAVLFQVRFFVIASLILWVGVILRFTLDQSAATNLLVPFGASVMVYAMGYLEMRRRPALERSEPQQPPAKKYEKSTLTPERSERYLNKLLELMEHEQPFTDGDLTIQKLAERLAIPANHLSQTINERLNQTFSDFVNSYRVEEAKRRLLDPAFKHYSVLGIAEEVGFNSKSSFNSVFKKHTNMTPSEFRKASS
ncbi:MAG TPA: helix-turn-helix domain-containing protein [Pyrinomonadaceae bacterium]|jgi:AraC-like DNA-binding protein